MATDEKLAYAFRVHGTKQEAGEPFLYAVRCWLPTLLCRYRDVELAEPTTASGRLRQTKCAMALGALKYEVFVARLRIELPCLQEAPA